MLKAKVVKMLKELMSRPECHQHSKHQRDYQLKIDYINSKYEKKNQHSKSYQVLVTRESAKRMLNHFPKAQVFNDMLADQLTEEELQIVFEDMRFFFKDDRVYKVLSIFHELDIFEGEQFKIKETYQKKRVSEMQKRMGNMFLDWSGYLRHQNKTMTEKHAAEHGNKPQEIREEVEEEGDEEQSHQPTLNTQQMEGQQFEVISGFSNDYNNAANRNTGRSRVEIQNHQPSHVDPRTRYMSETATSGFSGK